MFLPDRELLRHIKDEAGFVLEATSGKDLDGMINDQVLCRAVVRSLEIIGEASKKLSTSFKAEHTEVEWRKMAGTRDRLIHDYFEVDYEIVWDIIRNKLPFLQEYIDNILTPNQEGN